jgi:hypothetical protein
MVFFPVQHILWLVLFLDYSTGFSTYSIVFRLVQVISSSVQVVYHSIGLHGAPIGFVAQWE